MFKLKPRRPKPEIVAAPAATPKQAKSPYFDHFEPIARLAGLVLPWAHMTRNLLAGGADKHVRLFETRCAVLQPYVCYGATKAGRSRHSYQSIMIDIDSDFTIDRWNAVSPVPVATLTGKRRSDGSLQRPHPLIVLKYSVVCAPTTDSQRSDLKRYKRICNVLYDIVEKAGGRVDRGQKILTKNPDSQHWDYDEGEIRSWTLHELEEALGLRGTSLVQRPTVQQPTGPVPDLAVQRARISTDDIINGRNDALFHTLRRDAYAARRRGLQDHEFESYLVAQAAAINSTFSQPLADNEVRHTRKSIFNYCNRRSFANYEEDKNRGAARHLIEPKMNLPQRQRVGARYTNKVRQQSTREKVEAAIVEAGPAATKKAVARLAGVALNSVKKYWVEPADLAVKGGVNTVSSEGGETEKHSEATPGDRESILQTGKGNQIVPQVGGKPPLEDGNLTPWGLPSDAGTLGLRYIDYILEHTSAGIPSFHPDCVPAGVLPYSTEAIYAAAADAGQDPDQICGWLLITQQNAQRLAS